MNQIGLTEKPLHDDFGVGDRKDTSRSTISSNVQFPNEEEKDIELSQLQSTFNVQIEARTPKLDRRENRLRYKTRPTKRTNWMKLLRCINRPITHFILLISLLALCSLLLINHFWDLSGLMGILTIILYVMFLQVLWKSFYLMFYCITSLSNLTSAQQTFCVGMELLQHYIVVVVLKMYHSSPLCHGRASDYLFCFIKIDLMLDMINLFTGSALFMLIAFKRQTVEERYAWYRRAQIIEYALTLIPMIFYDLKTTAASYCFVMIVIRYIVYIWR